MTTQRRLPVALLLVGALLTVAIFGARNNCPSPGLGLTREKRNFYRLKNRTVAPSSTDFDDRVTLAALLQPGEDWNRWSAYQAARVEGYVVSVAPGPLELTNCFAPGRRDTHIHIGLRPDSPPAEQVVLETTPRMEDFAAEQGWDWSSEKLKATLLGRRVRFEGWLLFDDTHAAESENVSPLRPGNWRATAWEIHPVTKFEITE